MLAGICLGLPVGYLIRAVAAPRTDSARAGRVLDQGEPKDLRREFDMLRLDVQDTLEKAEHLYDRVRKRAGREEPPPTPTNAAAANGPLTRAQIVARARAARGDV